MKHPDVEKFSSKAASWDAGIPDISADAFDMIGRMLKSLRGFNIAIYKDKCIRRRIAIRIRATRCLSAEEYCQLLVENEAEVDHLLKVLTIHVSQFYRNQSTFEKLRKDILPPLFARSEQEGGDWLKVWSVGCSSGEEPYTIALILKNFFGAETVRKKVSILATDVDAGIIEVARKGIYGAERIVEVPQPILKRFFRAHDGTYHLAQEIKEMVTFRQGDLFYAGSYQESDLILCRNVLIYFERWQQEKIISGFADALRKGGILVLGKSEALFGESRKRFQTVCPVERIYRVEEKGFRER